LYAQGQPVAQEWGLPSCCAASCPYAYLLWLA
jgi:hypothetical protein